MSETAVELAADNNRLEDQLAKADAALTEIRKIAWRTHVGQTRAYTALSQIDQIARDGLSMTCGKTIEAMTLQNLPSSLKYSLYASLTLRGIATLWDANAKRRDGSFVAGVSADTPTAALELLAQELANG